MATNFEHNSCLPSHTLVPSAPTILAVEATSSTSISVKWAACTNDGGSPITGYIVEHRSALDPASPFETHLVGEDVYSTTVDGLTPSTKYEVRVRVENAVGRSQPSVTMETKTKDSGELKSLVILKEPLWMSLALLILQIMNYYKNTCVAVLGRNLILFRCVFRSHCCIRSAVVQNFH